MDVCVPDLESAVWIIGKLPAGVLGDVLALGDRLALGLKLALGDREAEGLSDLLGDSERLAEALALLDGLSDAEAEDKVAVTIILLLFTSLLAVLITLIST